MGLLEVRRFCHECASTNCEGTHSFKFIVKVSDNTNIIIVIIIIVIIIIIIIICQSGCRYTACR
jgi:t-SNARE complex subunit (syntaxin)